MRWYANKVGELVPYLGDSMGAYKSREDAGYINFVHYEDAEVIPELTQLEQLQKAVVDTKAACNAADASYDAAYAGRVYAAFAVADATWDAAYDAWDKARDELAEYLGTSAMTDEEKEQFYWDNPEAIPDKEQDNG